MRGDPAVLLPGGVVGLISMVAVIEANESPASTHCVTSGNTVEKMFASIPAAPKGGGNSGKLRLMPTSTVTETFASTSLRSPRLARPDLMSVVLPPDGAVESVALVVLPQFAIAFVDSFASRRGRFIDTKTSALS
jgi:hypothetical protein